MCLSFYKTKKQKDKRVVFSKERIKKQSKKFFEERCNSRRNFFKSPFSENILRKNTFSQKNF